MKKNQKPQKIHVNYIYFALSEFDITKKYIFPGSYVQNRFDRCQLINEMNDRTDDKKKMHNTKWQCFNPLNVIALPFEMRQFLIEQLHFGFAWISCQRGTKSLKPKMDIKLKLKVDSFPPDHKMFE